MLRRAGHAALVAAGLTALVLIVRHIGLATIAGLLRQVGWSFWLIVFIYGAHTALRGVVVALVLVFLGGTAAALFGDRGYLDVGRQQQRFQELADLHAANQLRVEALRRDIERLKTDPAAIERIARENLGYVAKGELTLLLPGDDPGEPRGLDAKKGSGIVPAVRSTP